jgi:transmembrane sensor
MNYDVHDVNDRAALWVLRSEEPSWTDVDQAELDAWLEESLIHRIAFLRQREGWRAADRIAALSSSIAQSKADVPSGRLRGFVPWVSAAALAGLLLAGSVGYWLRSPEK